MTPHDALVFIAYARPDGLLRWAKDNGVEEHVIKAFEGFAPRWRETAEYRGATVHILRRIAEKALDDEERSFRDQSPPEPLDSGVPGVHE